MPEFVLSFCSGCLFISDLFLCAEFEFLSFCLHVGSIDLNAPDYKCVLSRGLQWGRHGNVRDKWYFQLLDVRGKVLHSNSSESL